MVSAPAFGARNPRTVHHISINHQPSRAVCVANRNTVCGPVWDVRGRKIEGGGYVRFGERLIFAPSLSTKLLSRSRLVPASTHSCAWLRLFLLCLWRRYPPWLWCWLLSPRARLLLDDKSVTPPRLPCANWSNPGCCTEKLPCWARAAGILIRVVVIV